MAARINIILPEHHHDGSVPTSPTMSQSQSQNNQGRQTVGYPSPQLTSYPSPGPSTAQYAYPAPSNQQANEPYRASPTGSNGSLSLPSMRSLDPLQQQQAHQQHMGGAALPPPVAQMAPYYQQGGQALPHPQHQYPNVTSDPSMQNMRYALPATESRQLSGGRHKKEIKRRTKTGCLTCRKRRIKCDENHPACRNCQKSKRDCLGYDPIFKQQPGPAAIQPAPSSAPSQNPIMAASNPYGNQPSMLQGYGAQVPNMGYEPALSAGVSSPGSTGPQFDYSSAIDPALEAAVPPPPKSGGQFQSTSTSGMPNFREDLKRELQSVSPGSSGASDSPHLRGGASFPFHSNSPQSFDHGYETSAYASAPAKRQGIKMSDLLSIRGEVPTTVPDKLQEPEFIDEVKHLYHSIYSPGLENFLETKWFHVKGISKLLGDTQMLEQFAMLLYQLDKTSVSDEKDMSFAANVEARTVWALASMVRAAASELSNGVRSEGTIPASDDATEAGNRLTVFENLLCGDVAPANVLTNPSGAADSPRIRELRFWYNLGKFVTYDPDSAVPEIDDTLAALRNLLDGRENRDVLYSIAIVRAMRDRIVEYSEHTKPFHFDESDARSKLHVAKRFINAEGEGGTGTTNVIRRFCELAQDSIERS